MPVEFVATLAVVLFMVLMLIEVPVAFSLLISGAVGTFIVAGPNVAFSALAAVPYSAVAKYDLLILPMFILLGAVVANAGIATRIFESANRLVGWMPGGLAVTTIFACTIFGGISGSSAADVATLGRVSIGEMRRHGYSARFAAGLVAAAGMVAILIPPSIPLVIYGILTGLPIGSLLLAGILPGLLTTALFTIYAVAHARWSPARPNGQAEKQALPRRDEPVPAEPKRYSFAGLLYALILFGVVVGGIYTGIFTSTEAAAVGAFAAFSIAVPLTILQRGALLPMIKSSVMEASETTAMIFALLVGTAVFTYFLALTQLPSDLAQWAVALPIPPHLVILAFLILLIPLGMFLDGMSMLLLTVPIAYPIVQQLGFDGIWFGVLVVTMIELGLVTPPVGINVFVVSGLVEDLSLEEAFAGVAPFILIQLLVTAAIFLFPGIALFLPELSAAR